LNFQVRTSFFFKSVELFHLYFYQFVWSYLSTSSQVRAHGCEGAPHLLGYVCKVIFFKGESIKREEIEAQSRGLFYNVDKPTTVVAEKLRGPFRS